MAEFLDVVKTISAIAGPIVGGGGVWAYLSKRQNSRTSSPAAIANSNAAIAEAISEHMEILLSAHARDQADLRRTVSRQGKQLKVLAKDVAECNRRHLDCENHLADVRARIDTMLSEGSPAATLVVNPHPLKDQIDAPD